jgi:serine/threonine-protein kinase RIO1
LKNEIFNALPKRNPPKKTKKTILNEITIAGVRDDLIQNQHIDEYLSVIGAGKEATVLLARETGTKELVCVKVFRYYTSMIKKSLQGSLRSDTANAAAKNEYWNLFDMYSAGVPVPRPRKLIQNAVIMDFISNPYDPEKPAPILSDIDIRANSDPEEILHEAINILAKIFLNAHYVHGDYSDYNLLVGKDGLVTMDVTQSIQYNQKTFTNTPVRIRIDSAFNIFKTDLHNLNKCFEKKYRISIDEKSVCDEIQRELPKKLQVFLNKASPIRSSSQYSPELRYLKQLDREQARFQRSKKKHRKKK